MKQEDIFIQSGTSVVETELEAIQGLKNSINNEFARACHYLMACEGRVIVIGMGKSGHVGSKIAATLASTGTPAFFVHAGEASHGDFGMITGRDIVIVISNSGETEEIVRLLPLLKRLGVPLIALTGNPKSTMAIEAEVHLDVQVKQEACPLGLAPTSSSTAALVMGDALAIALLNARGFTEEDFAMSHPGGSLGRRLLLHVSDIMHKGERTPKVSENAHLRDALEEMGRKGLGMTAVVDDSDHLIGIFTDGDLRRMLKDNETLQDKPISEYMTRNPVTIKQNILASEALQIMEKNKINGIVVVNDENMLIGAFNMHDLLRAGVV